MKLINADAFKERLNNMYYVYLQDCSEDLIDAIDCEVTYFAEEHIEVDIKRIGEWILCNDTYFSKCSICGDIWLNEECKNYCPNCGAHMRSNNNGKK